MCSWQIHDFRPVALTSLVMKTFEKLVKQQILKQVEDQLDPFQSAYRAGRGVEDAILTRLNVLAQHLEASKTHARLLFIDFSSAINTIRPCLLAEKLLYHFNLNFNLVGYIVEFLSNRSQCVRLNGVLSSKLFSSTGFPQGCVLSPLLFILYTNDRQSTYYRHFMKCADDTVIVSLLNNDERGHGPVVDDFIAWCKDFYLFINVSKTKDVIIDFCRSQPSVTHLVIQEKDVEIVSHYKYLGIIINNTLCFEPNTDALCKKVQRQQFFFLRKMKLFNVCDVLMALFD